MRWQVAFVWDLGADAVKSFNHDLWGTSGPLTCRNLCRKENNFRICPPDDVHCIYDICPRDMLTRLDINDPVRAELELASQCIGQFAPRDGLGIQVQVWGYLSACVFYPNKRRHGRVIDGRT